MDKRFRDINQRGYWRCNLIEHSNTDSLTFANFDPGHECPDNHNTTWRDKKISSIFMFDRFEIFSEPDIDCFLLIYQLQ